MDHHLGFLRIIMVAVAVAVPYMLPFSYMLVGQYQPVPVLVVVPGLGQAALEHIVLAMFPLGHPRVGCFFYMHLVGLGGIAWGRAAE